MLYIRVWRILITGTPLRSHSFLVKDPIKNCFGCKVRTTRWSFNGTRVFGEPRPGLENVPSNRCAQKERSVFLSHRAAAKWHPYSPFFWAAVWATPPTLPNKTHSRVHRNLNAVTCVPSPACSGYSPLIRTPHLFRALCYTRHIHHWKERDAALRVCPFELGMSHRSNPCRHPTYHTRKTGDMAALSCGIAMLLCHLKLRWSYPPRFHCAALNGNGNDSVT